MKRLETRVSDLERAAEPELAAWRFVYLGADDTWSISSPTGILEGKGPLPIELGPTDYVIRSNIRADAF